MSPQGDTNTSEWGLLDEQSISWRERDVPLHERGVRLSWLIQFVESIYGTANDPLLSSYQDQLKWYERAVAQLYN